MSSWDGDFVIYFPAIFLFDILRVFNVCLTNKLNCSFIFNKWNESEVLFVDPVEAYMEVIL